MLIRTLSELHIMVMMTCWCSKGETLRHLDMQLETPTMYPLVYESLALRVVRNDGVATSSSRTQWYLLINSLFRKNLNLTLARLSILVYTVHVGLV